MSCSFLDDLNKEESASHYNATDVDSRKDNLGSALRLIEFMDDEDENNNENPN